MAQIWDAQVRKFETFAGSHMLHACVLSRSLHHWLLNHAAMTELARERVCTQLMYSAQACQLVTELRQPEGSPKMGMCMSMQLFQRPPDAALYLAVGYEAGHVAVWNTQAPAAPLAVARLHEEPVLGLAIDANGTGMPHAHYSPWTSFLRCLALCCPR